MCDSFALDLDAAVSSCPRPKGPLLCVAHEVALCARGRHPGGVSIAPAWSNITGQTFVADGGFLMG